jgi:peptidoglycan/LPS O-acetylase OafA/YrhL
VPEPVEGSRSYLAGLDGIRAVAVLGVIAFHIGAGWAAGGLLGVGVFFVLSGYLITDLLVAQFRERHTINLGQFWLRRARRLLPALFLMLFVVIGWSTLFDRAQLGALRDDLPSAVAYYSNWWFIHQHISYFARFGPPTPFGHLWSLAIEEQFYLLWPLLLLLGLRLARSRRPLIALILAAAAASAIEMGLLYVPFGDPTRVYDGTDTRAFALLIGAALAIAWPRDMRISKLTAGARRVLEAAGSLALVGIVVLFCTTSEYETFLYRGGILLCAILSAVLIAVTIHPGTRFAHLLGVAPLAWIGKRSYGIYLWSYPVIVLTTPVGKTPGAFHAVVDIAVTFVLAALSWTYLEEPIRHGALAGLWRRARSLSLPRLRPTGWLVGSFAIANVLLCVVGLTGLVSGPSDPSRSTVTAILPTGSGSSGSTTTSEPNGAPGPGITAVTTSTTPPAPKGAGILAIGDSVMIDAAPYLRQLLPGIKFDAVVGQQLYQVQDDVAKLRAEKVVGNRLVLELGTNGPYSLIALNNLIRSFGPMEKIVLINAYVDRPWEQFVNQTIAAEAKKHPNITVINWFELGGHHPADFYPDGIHLLPAGAQYYADLIAKAIAVPPSTSAQVPAATKLLSCAGTTIVKPTSFDLNCATSHIELTRTSWSSWSTDAATGTTRFGIDACQSKCDSSTMHYFPNSRVRLSKPIVTKYGEVFSSLVVRYKVEGSEKTFSFTWKGDVSI